MLFSISTFKKNTKAVAEQLHILGKSRRHPRSFPRDATFILLQTNLQAAGGFQKVYTVLENKMTYLEKESMCAGGCG